MIRGTQDAGLTPDVSMAENIAYVKCVVTGIREYPPLRVVP